MNFKKKTYRQYPKFFTNLKMIRIMKVTFLLVEDHIQVTWKNVKTLIMKFCPQVYESMKFCPQVYESMKFYPQVYEVMMSPKKSPKLKALENFQMRHMQI